MKILYITTVSLTVKAFLIPHIELLVNAGHQVDVACHVMNSQIDSLRTDYGSAIYNIPFSRSLRSRDNIEAYKVLKKLIIAGDYDIIHTHTPIASAITRLICRNKMRAKVYYTAHGFHFHKGAPIKNWLLYFPVEKVLSRYTDTLITINKEDFRLAIQSLDAVRTFFVSGVGLDIDRFKSKVINRDKKREEIGVGKDSILLLSIGELNHNKNHALVLKAMKKMEQSNIEYVICGDGDLENELLELAAGLGLADKVHLLGKRSDVAEILKAADIFIHPSKREGLPVALMEAMASGLPIVCSKIRGNSDLITNAVGGYLFKSNNLNSLTKMLRRILDETENYDGFSRNNQSVIESYSIEQVLEELSNIYG